ncbi:DUF421 domain-containing protein [Bacillus tuaregi]|uniref:DUF421 domain-containing protein n=1 Tax=Bacillus tuaregi TaxID=1816695 RepID=UPI0008F89B00|nr:DUF421 domain-containing protein [Bacillus tuaregi]
MYINILSDLVVGYIALFLVVKRLGKTQLSQITPFDFISALVLGELVGNTVFDDKRDTLPIVFAITVWGTLIYLTEFLTQKFRKLRYIFEGKPAILINKGKLDWKELKKNQIDIDQLQEMLRMKDVFSIQEVEYAILENNGGISVLRKSAANQPTNQDLNIQVEDRALPLTIISDGVVLENNLEKAGVTREWLQKEIKNNGLNTEKEICYAEYEPGKKLFVQTY